MKIAQSGKGKPDMLNQTVDRDPDAWGSCESGQLAGLSQKMRAQHTRKTQARVAGGLLAASLAFLAMAYVPGAGQSETRESISCSECVALMPAYQRHVAGLEEMPAKDYEAVECHFEGCDKCRNLYEEKFSIVAWAGDAVNWLKSAWFAPEVAG